MVSSSQRFGPSYYAGKKSTYKDLPSGGFEFNGVRFNKEGQPEAITSERGRFLVEKAIEDQKKSIDMAKALEEQQKLDLQQTLKPKQIAQGVDFTQLQNIKDPQNLANILRLRSQANLKGNDKLLEIFNKAKESNTLDIVTGGYFSRQKLINQEVNLNQRIQNFNKRFGGRELGEQEYNLALEQERFINEKAQQIEQEKLALSKKLRTEIGNIYNINVGLEAEYIKKGSVGQIPGRVVPISPDFSIIPASNIPQGVQAVKFLGTQRIAKDGKIITDLAYITSDFRTGIAKGATIFKGDDGLTIVLGKTGKKVLNFPSGTTKIRDTYSFIGRDYSKARSTILTLKNKLDNFNVLTSKEGFIQASKGELAIFKGTKAFYPQFRLPGGLSIKKAKILNDESRSISAILNQGDYSKILGKARNVKAGDTAFYGIIKQISSGEDLGSLPGSSLSLIRKVKQAQLNKALSKVAGLTAGSLAEAKNLGALTKEARVLVSSVLIKNQLRGTPLTKANKIVLIKKVNNILNNVPKSQVNSKTLTALASVLDQYVRTNQKTRQLANIAQKSQQKATQETALEQKQLSRLRQLLKSPLMAKQVFRAINLGVPIKAIPPLPIGQIPDKKRLFKGSKGAKMGYDVYGKVGNRFIKLNKAPLRRIDALSRGAYAIDNSTARTYKIVPAGYVSSFGKINPYEVNYYFRKLMKFRQYRIKKGKRINLRETFIEKRKRLIDTYGEKRGLRLARLKSQLNRKPYKKQLPKRKMLKRSKSIMDNLEVF